MSLHLYDTSTRSVRDFVPLEPGKASIYLCGLTVQGPPHIGHVRNWVTTDILRRWLTYSDYQVTFVRNVTDIDDKILLKSDADGEPWWGLAYRNEREIRAAELALGCLPPSYEPRATGHVTEMIELITRLIDAGHAYASGGDVFFDVASFPAYGALSGQRISEMQPAGDSLGDLHKRDPRDFALWKGHKPGEPATASWPTPWGPGRPGWHLECSAMATKYLGPSFDIHGGGLDLVFPHHENEIAQSAGAGDGFARYWLHTAMLNLAGEKMSKSVGNTLQVSEMIKTVQPAELRYYLGSAHYRSVMEYSPTALAESGAAYRRIENFVERAVEALDDLPAAAAVTPEFATAMDDDLGVPLALAAVHNVVREGNTALADGELAGVAAALGSVLTMTGLLGINPLEWLRRQGGGHGGGQGGSEGSAGPKRVIDALVQLALHERTSARERKDFDAADAIRDQLTTAGVLVEDTPSGPRWTLKD